MAEQPWRRGNPTAGSGRSSPDEAQTRPARLFDDPKAPLTIEEVVGRVNMRNAYARVKQNGGAAGIDDMSVDDLGKHLVEQWDRVRQEILGGTYTPKPVRKVEIPKPDGKGVRTLGIPTVMDRMIQQAVLQVLQPQIDPMFSDGSFGFRPGRSTHDAVKRAHEHIKAGGIWVVDLDLEKFFDRVNHDVLMDLLAKRVEDKRILRLIRSFLQAGMMEGGLTSPRTEGTPQGGPLSPFLSNVMLHEFDAELERRGHRFARYADDCNVYVRSKAAGERVMASLERFLMERLRLRINREKSAVAQPWERKFLGYTVARHGKKLQVAPQSVKRLQTKLKPLVSRKARGARLGTVFAELTPIIRGWVAYYRNAAVKQTFERIDKWVRRHIRASMWRRWKKPKTRAQELVKLGVGSKFAYGLAFAGHGPWWCAGKSTMSLAMSAGSMARMGLVSFLDEHRRLNAV